MDFLLDELGYFPRKNKSNGSSSCGKAAYDSGDRQGTFRPKGSPPSETKKLQSAQKQLKDSSLKPKKWLPDGFSGNGDIAAALSLFSEQDRNDTNESSTHTVESASSARNKDAQPVVDLGQQSPPKHLSVRCCNFLFDKIHPAYCLFPLFSSSD